jgi:hypothetical protein
LPHFEVQVRGGGVARLSHAAQDLPSRDPFARSDQILVVVRVQGQEPTRMPHHDHVAISTQSAGEDHLAFVRASDRRALRGHDVEAVVGSALSLPVSARNHIEIMIKWPTKARRRVGAAGTER